MQLEKISLLFLTLALSFIAFSTGCNKNTDKKVYTMDYQIKKIFGADNTTPEEKAAMAFDTTDPDVRRTAIELLSRKQWALRDPYLKRFAQLTKPGIEKDPSVRAVAVRALGKAHNRKYMPEILASLDDPSPVVRWDAAVVMQSMPDKQAVITLQKMAISDDSVDVRASAANALRQYRTTSVFRTLLRCMADSDFTVRSAAHASLVFQTGQDKGYDPENWAQGEGKIGMETLPEPVVHYKKRPWWDWAKMTKETEAIAPAYGHPANKTGDQPNTEKEKPKRPWWDWFGTTQKD